MRDGPQGRSEILALLERHDIVPRRSLGQHFLVDPNTVRKIIEIAGVARGDRVVEVGSGTGTLTRALAGTGALVTAYEVDERLRPVLDEVLAGCGDVEVRFADALRVDLAHALGTGPWVMVANLPYNVGTPLVLNALRNVPALERFVVMVQREVADRLGAPPGDRRYGLPSVVVGMYASVTTELRVSPHVFHPPPPVESAVVVLERRHAPAPVRERAIEIAAAAFGQRRKMLRRSLRDAVSDGDLLLEAAGLDPSARAEMLSPAQYLRLAKTEAEAGNRT